VQGANNSNSRQWQLQATSNSKELLAATKNEPATARSHQQQLKMNQQQQGVISSN
jgi:hypothetical protein